MNTIIMSVLLTIVVPIVLCLTIKFNKKDSQIDKNNLNIIIKTSKKLKFSLFGFYILGLIATFLINIDVLFYEEESNVFFESISLETFFITIFTFLSFLLFKISKHNYFIVYDNRIIKKNIFEKDIIYSLNEISYEEEKIKDVQKVYLYDSNKKLIFTISSNFYINVDKFINILNNNNILK